MRGQLIVKRYAQALFEISRDASRQDQLRDDIETLKRLFSEAPEIREYCLNPPDSRRKNRLFIETAFLPYLSSYTGKTVELLLGNNRLEALPLLADALQEKFDAAAGVTRVTVVSGSELEDSVKEGITEKMEKRTGGRVAAEWLVSEKPGAGMTIQWSDRYIDLSLQGRLSQLMGVMKRNKS